MYAQKASEGEEGEDKELLIKNTRRPFLAICLALRLCTLYQLPSKTSKSKSNLYKKKTYQKKHQLSQEYQ